MAPPVVRPVKAFPPLSARVPVQPQRASIAKAKSRNRKTETGGCQKLKCEFFIIRNKCVSSLCMGPQKVWESAQARKKKLEDRRCCEIRRPNDEIRSPSGQ